MPTKDASYLRELGVFGFDHVEVVILAALVKVWLLAGLWPVPIPALVDVPRKVGTGDGHG